MYHHSSSSSSSSCCYGSNGLFLPPQPAGAAFQLSPLPSAGSYDDLQSQSQAQPQQPPMQRRVLMSTGDLVGAAPVAVGRYSAEERRERIEKYRTKRNQRNFQKKITYACRKTLADSRPRVKGRFARNDDHPEAALFTDATTTATEVSSSNSSLMNEELPNDANTSSSSSMPDPEWWPATHGAMAMEDEDLLAAYLGVSSINLY